MLAYLSF